MKQAQTSATQSASSTNAEPRRIEILSEDEEPAATPTPQSQDQNVEKLRQQVIGLQEELQRLKRGQ
jgi:polyhydroxyalkanoate synthesis regulator phasin